ncbi:uncharacterized protein LOC113862192 [Abrus precatorius]|uniref:Uncharacterized protein LOC113862192 n=1 Tax=Abrus precatorius TaxID=3816 RepID=A0A8B8L8P5_ABRPR|nr:uncharacterized protein LOC113862192 [Abrus precatorius]
MSAQLEQITNLLSQRVMGTLPSQPEPNPRKQCNAITLRSGKNLNGTKTHKSCMPVLKEEHALASPCTPMLPETKWSCLEQHALADNEGTIVLDGSKVVLNEGTPVLDDEKGRAYHPYVKNETREDASVVTKLKVPFPQRLMSSQRDPQFNKFLGILRKLHINIPFVEPISQMPKYAKFLKEMLSSKKKLEEFETVRLNEECSAILLRKLPLKLKDLGSFIIPCTIGNSYFDKALCDLGASINLMLFSVFKRLGMQEPKPTSISLQLTDRLITYPKGIVEDVLVKVDKFMFPADFIILDMEEDDKVPIILGRPFLATGRTIIDVQQGKLTLRCWGGKVVGETIAYQGSHL